MLDLCRPIFRRLPSRQVPCPRTPPSARSRATGPWFRQPSSWEDHGAIHV